MQKTVEGRGEKPYMAGITGPVFQYKLKIKETAIGGRSKTGEKPDLKATAPLPGGGRTRGDGPGHGGGSANMQSGIDLCKRGAGRNDKAKLKEKR